MEVDSPYRVETQAFCQQRDARTERRGPAIRSMPDLQRVYADAAQRVGCDVSHGDHVDVGKRGNQLVQPDDADGLLRSAGWTVRKGIVRKGMPGKCAPQERVFGDARIAKRPPDD